MNKHFSLLAAGLIALGGLASCNKSAKNAQDASAQDTAKPVELTQTSFSKEDNLLNMNLTALVPTGNDAASTAMRDTLLATLQQELTTWIVGDDKPQEPVKDTKDVDALAQKCYDSNRAQMLKDQKEFGISYTAPYEWQFTLDTLTQTDRYIVFDARGYQYMGGAHGGVFGRGAITFSKADGQPFTRWFTDPNNTKLHQMMLDGIAQYFSQSEGKAVSVDSLADYLLVKPSEVVLPVESPRPTPDGLGFSYGQYEIAAYAAGMPSFILPYDQLLPYLSDEAKELLGL